ncbi:MAG: amidohydrolase family protein, partial [Candidatus Aminicenantes bacterium]|nr:amidohydrolase family protein [Candidatus Aminicenantes bacterium]
SLMPMRTWLGKNKDLLLQEKDILALLEPLTAHQLKELYKKISADSLLSPAFQEYLDRLPRQEIITLLAGVFLNSPKLRGPGNDKERVLFLQRWNNPVEKEKIRKEIKQWLNERMEPGNIIIARCIEKNLEGKSLAEISEMKRKSPEDTAVELHLMDTLAVPLSICEEDIEYLMKKEYVATGSDGFAPFYGIDLYHERAYTTFLYKIKKYGLERKILPLSHIIRSQTSLPAEIMNWPDRGWIKPGYIADIAVIDPGKIKLCSSISNPHCYSSGVGYLLVNGEVVIDEGKWNGKLPGRVIKLKK